MNRRRLRIVIVLVATGLAGPGIDGLGLRPAAPWTVGPAEAIVGRPLTPVSVAGATRRTVRRTEYVAGAATTAAVATPAAVATTAAVTTAAVAGAAVGTAVAALPGGCVSVPAAGGVYYNCAGVFYQPAYQGPNLVYVVASPP